MIERKKVVNDYDPRAEKINTLKALIPESVKEGKIDLDALRSFLEDEVAMYDEDNEPFSFSWPGKKKARQLAFSKPKKTLELVKGQGIDEDETRNIFIEGDNLEVCVFA
ncbi:hypothetical protein [Cysteiniphilum litorale]|uniref:hypothetical protein n=1 Tax=Cysteiniphilum litorale TaxID=2056700 RepID=UPI003F881E7C